MLCNFARYDKNDDTISIHTGEASLLYGFLDVMKRELNDSIKDEDYDKAERIIVLIKDMKEALDDMGENRYKLKEEQDDE